MKILFVSDNFPPERNASASRVYERARYWSRWGHEVTILTGAPNFPDGRVFAGYRNHWYRVEEVDGIRVVRVKTFIAPNQGVVLRTIDFLSFMLAASAAGLIQTRPDVVAATSPQFFSAIAGRFIATSKRVPFVFEISDLWPAFIKAVGAMRESFALKLLERCELSLYNAAAQVVALTNAFKLDLVGRGVPAEKVTVILNGVDLPRYSPTPRDTRLASELGLKDDFVVGYIGTHGMAHALERVLDAAVLLADAPRIRFLFVGPGAARDGLVKLSSQRGLRNVIFVPSQPKEMMPAYWSQCDLALVHLKNSPEFSTVIPSKIFEAMAMGVPILLAAPEGEATAIVRNTGAGTVVPAEQPRVLAQCVSELASSPERVTSLAAKARAAAPLYSREKQAREMLNVFHRAAHTEHRSWSFSSRTYD
jgi:glycosyltransferase involved in cell wall biosynthesis